MNPCYGDGSEIHVGNPVSYAHQKGTVVFVADRDEYSADFPESDWPKSQFPSGFMIRFKNGACLFLESGDAHLEKDS